MIEFKMTRQTEHSKGKEAMVMEKLVDRFMRYAAIDTQSDEESPSSPSTAKQFDLARLLVRELEEIGLEKVLMSEAGIVTAELPATSERPVPSIGFIAHMDTAPSMSGARVKPRIVESYDGGDILLNEGEQVILSPSDFPEIAAYEGQALIVTDGTTLLGADDKAGIAEIMTMAAYLAEHPEIERGTVKVAFTPDEEVGRGTEHFDVEAFGADFAYTVDGGGLGELEYENFNAARANLFIQGRNVHPGTAKNKMVNALGIAMELDGLLPKAQRPEHTEGYEGFFHLLKMEGDVESARMTYILRDHDGEKLEIKKQVMVEAVAFLNLKYGPGRVRLEMRDEYRNMKEKIEPVFHIVETAVKAMEAMGVAPVVKPIRGGTDGAMLSHKGLPTPNLFTGGHNFHGKYEYIPVESMEKAVDVLVEIVKAYGRS